MRLNKTQWCWLLYDPGNAAFALLVRAVFAPLFFMLCARGHWSESTATGNWGIVCSAAGIAAGALSLFFGALADAGSCRKRYLAFSTLIGIAATLGLAAVSDYRAVLILYFIALAAFMAGNSFYDSLLISVAEPHEFSFLSTFAYGFGYLGGFIPFVLILTAGFFIGSSEITARAAFVLAAFWWGLFTIPLMLKVKEQKSNHPPIAWHHGFVQLGKTLKEIALCRNALIFLIAYFLYIDGVSTILLMATPISVDIGMSQLLLMGTILGLQVIGFPATIGFGFLARKFGARKMVYTALALYVLTAVLIGILAFCDSYNTKLVLFLSAALLIALAQGGIQSLSRSLFGLLIPEGKAAEFFGVYNIFGKFTTILGPVLVYIAGRVWGESVYGIVMLIVPFLLGGFMLSKVKFPDGQNF